jgi:truncated hemoglobin YjbI
MVFDWWWWLVIALAWIGTVALAVLGGYKWGEKETIDKYRAQLTQHAADVQDRKPKPTESNPIVCPPPMVGQETVMQWGLRTYHGRLGVRGANADPEYGVWSLMVEDFYTEAAKDLGIARHFNFTDMAALQRKFTATLVMVLDKGLREQAIKAMEKVHKDFDITEAEYDRTVAVLGEILHHYKVPAEAFPAIEKIVLRLKPVIAKPQRVTA